MSSFVKFWRPQPAQVVPLTGRRSRRHIAYGKKRGYSDEQVRAIIADESQNEVWKNDRYQVHVRHLKGDADAIPMVQLSIRRVDRQPIHDCRSPAHKKPDRRPGVRGRRTLSCRVAAGRQREPIFPLCRARPVFPLPLWLPGAPRQ